MLLYSEHPQDVSDGLSAARVWPRTLKKSASGSKHEPGSRALAIPALSRPALRSQSQAGRLSPHGIGPLLAPETNDAPNSSPNGPRREVSSDTTTRFEARHCFRTTVPYNYSDVSLQHALSTGPVVEDGDRPGRTGRCGTVRVRLPQRPVPARRVGELRTAAERRRRE